MVEGLPRPGAVRDPPALRDLNDEDIHRISIKKESLEEKLGIGTTEVADVGKKIVSVKHGPVMRWNEAHPEQALRPDDVIVEVNGARGGPKHISERMQASLELDIKFWRPPLQPAPVSAWPEGLDRVTYYMEGMKIGLLVWMAWDTDHTDVDLHVVEPDGTEVYYGNASSRTGGQVSRDFTQGYGPEVYLSRDAPTGRYRVRAKYYSSHQASASTGTTSAVIWTFTRFGGDGHSAAMDFRQVRLAANKEMMDVLDVTLPGWPGDEGVSEFIAVESAPIFESAASCTVTGHIRPGQLIKAAAANAVKVVGGFTMVTLEGGGAVQSRALGPSKAAFAAP